MPEFLDTKAFAILCCCIILISKALYTVIIYKKSALMSKKQRNILTALSFMHPIITGIVCIIKCKQSARKKLSLFFMLAGVLVISLLSAALLAYNVHPKFYSSGGETVFYKSDVSFVDKNKNKYTFNFQTSGFDKLYINGTNDYLPAELCYLDENGYLIFDEDMSITARDEHSCIDADGSVYYPAEFSSFNKDGSVNYSFNSANFNYDRFKNAYTYENVPFYDENNNKYRYSFDSDIQKGFYTNISTGEKFENEYCFVDENGFLVYDKDHSFTMQKTESNIKTYTDSNGKTYYWASGVYWDKNGNMFDSYNNLL